MRTLRLVFDLLGLAVFGLLIALVVHNRETRISFDLVLFQLDAAPASLILVATLLGGAILGLLFSVPEWLRLRLRLRELGDKK